MLPALFPGRRSAHRTHRPGAGATRTAGPGAATVAAAVLGLGFFLTISDTTLVNVALPAIGRHWHDEVTGPQWVSDAYTLVFAALLLWAGTLADRIGAVRAFGTGLVLFGVTSALCGLAPGLGVLIAARAAQGAGAAIMLPASLALVSRAYPDPVERARAITRWMAGGGVAIAVGPVLGGALTSGLGWRWVFLGGCAGLPLGVLALLVLGRAARAAGEGAVSPPGGRRPDGRAPLDLGGQAAIGLAVAVLVFAVIDGGAHGYGSPRTVLALLLAAALGTAFVLVERSQPHPAVPLAFFRDPVVALCTATGFVLNFASYGLVFVLTLFFQQERGASALTAGLLFIPMTALTTVVNLAAGALTCRRGPKVPLILGQLVQAGALLALLSVGPHTGTGPLLLLLVPLGIGVGLAVPPLTCAMLAAVDTGRAGLASGILNSARQLGGAVGVAVCGALIAAPGGFMAGLHIVLLIGAALLLAGTAAVALLLPSGRGRPPG
ncbi:MFS transporter [Kitasatospora sp. NBC_01302]|uniref:MFS transporter n=1 Tax=Kitasatospora sp. NBC_01302 TaxID=2903575 RepID=UPI002E133A00|nr:MFS transporter [Kitasatospora sp. NBC_01302]